MGEPLDARERQELCDLFLDVGPDAPTLCEGWKTVDLAAHLVVRERQPLAMPGIVVPALGGMTERFMTRERRRAWPELVQRVRSGPPLGPGRVPRVRTLYNLNEYFVHHEDVRRANGREPRTDRPDLDDALWAILGRLGRVLVRRSPVGVEIRRDGGPTRSLKAAKDGGASVVVEGRPAELALFFTGRGDAAHVEVIGPSDAVERLRATPFGL